MTTVALLFGLALCLNTALTYALFTRLLNKLNGRLAAPPTPPQGERTPPLYSTGGDPKPASGLDHMLEALAPSLIEALGPMLLGSLKQTPVQKETKPVHANDFLEG